MVAADMLRDGRRDLALISSEAGTATSLPEEAMRATSRYGAADHQCRMRTECPMATSSVREQAGRQNFQALELRTARVVATSEHEVTRNRMN